MRSLVIIVGGILLLGVGLLVARWIGGAGTHAMLTIARLFIPVWLAVALINMWIGVSRAGYSVAEEFPIFLVIFLIPAGVAAFIWWKLS
jgi:hypothetical protein